MSEESLIPLSCGVYRVRPEGSSPASNHRLFSLLKLPGILSCSCAEGIREGLKSQIATKIAAESYLKHASDFADSDGGREVSGLLKYSLKHTNEDVYKYGHSMASGGEIAAKFLACAVDGKKITIGQTGEYQSYLFRGNQLQAIFDFGMSVEVAFDGVLQKFVGANSKLLCELASTNLEIGDVLVVSTVRDSAKFRASVKNVLSEKFSPQQAATLIAKEGVALEEQPEDRVVFQSATVFVIQVGQVQEGLIQSYEFREL